MKMATKLWMVLLLTVLAGTASASVSGNGADGWHKLQSEQQSQQLGDK